MEDKHNDIKILVATHKPYWLPREDVYLPIHAGREGKADLGYMGDNTGDNISARNANYCELTAMYWAWKNLKCDYLGLCHYRRYFAHWNRGMRVDSRWINVLERKDYQALLDKYDVIVPERLHFNHTVRAHYDKYQRKKDMDMTEKILGEKYPAYSQAFKEVMEGNVMHAFNMFVMKKELADEYMAWLFDILFELDKRTDLSDYNSFQARIYGFQGEWLFNVWLRKRQLRAVEVPVLMWEI